MEENEKPVCRLIGEDGNVFNIISRVSKVLRKEVSEEKAKEFREKAIACHSYDEVLGLCDDYVEAE
jgi:hypothetical protein